ncbi:Asp23/Gls24 family envelope stress response protein, partial [Bombilactobacillus bombi]|uniref:Asp23/Gls24 family envelope stress response protein n=1 Tax=Bombilactobacillus bombi TaxID=1303590 RepID=UPI0015E5F41D
MTDNKYIIIDPENQNNLGNVNIAPDVLEVLLGIAASKVDGVYGMRGTLADSILGREKRSKGVS